MGRNNGAKQKPHLNPPALKSQPVPFGDTTARRKTLPAPRALPEASTSNERLCWRYRHADHGGPWCFHNAAGDGFCGLLTRLANFESMTVNEAFHQGDYPGKDYDVDQIPNRAALDRLEALGLPDMTKISVLRLGGQQRLYGFLQDNIFHVIWWDPEHEIWPSTLRHT
jgi:hypothetical protein